MHRKPFFILIISFVFLSGCANLRTKNTVTSVPALIEKPFELKIGMQLLKGGRPALDKKFTANIKDVPIEVTAKLVEYFKSSSPLKELRYPAEADDDIIISGTIERFMWTSYSQLPTQIPIVNLYVYLGIPCKTAYGITSISLVIKDNKSGKVIDTIEATSKVDNSYNLYEFKKIDLSIELEESFKQAAEKLLRQTILAIAIFKSKSQ